MQVKKELRGLRDVGERTRQRQTEHAAAGETADPADAVVLDTVLALRQHPQAGTRRERGVQPLEFGALRALDELDALDQTLGRCLEKRGMRDSLAC